MHEIGTHVIDIQSSENTTIIYSNDIKVTWNQVTISLCTLGSTSVNVHSTNFFKTHLDRFYYDYQYDIV